MTEEMVHSRHIHRYLTHGWCWVEPFSIQYEYYYIHFVKRTVALRWMNYATKTFYILMVVRSRDSDAVKYLEFNNLLCLCCPTVPNQRK